MHSMGECGPKDLVEARRLYSLAAAQGHVDAEQVLNRMANAAAEQLLAEEEAENAAKSKASISKKSRKGKARAKPTLQVPPPPPRPREPEVDGEAHHSDGCEAADTGSAH
eukprot:3007687-Prymnesium_polylepis.1